MCLPTHVLAHSNNNNNNNSSESHPVQPPSSTFQQQSVLDLEEGLSEVVTEVFNAPKRRIDNEISRLYESVSALLMHCHIVDEVVARYRGKVWTSYFITGFAGLLSIGVTAGISYICDLVLGMDSSSGKHPNILENAHPETPTKVLDPGSFHVWIYQNKSRMMLGSGLLGALSTLGVGVYQYLSVLNMRYTCTRRETFDSIARELYNKEFTANDEFTSSIAGVVLPTMPSNITYKNIHKLPRVSKADFNALNRIINEDIANLRRQASPSFPVLSPVLTTSTQKYDNDEKYVTMLEDSLRKAYSSSSASGILPTTEYSSAPDDPIEFSATKGGKPGAVVDGLFDGEDHIDEDSLVGDELIKSV